MVRVTCASASRSRRKKWLKRAKGFWGDRKGHIRNTKNAVMKALAYNTAHRKQKKRDFRSLWITRVNVAARLNGISYGKLIHGLKIAGLGINRKMLAELAIHDPVGFTSIVDVAKKAHTN